MDNLRLAYYKAKRGKETKADVYSYANDLHPNLLKLRNSLLCGQICLGEYHYFTIYEPKQRVICAAPFADRILHHAIMNVCHPYFERFQIFDSYASRKDKGQYAALQRAYTFNKAYKWFCKLDIRKYFDSIVHNVLLQLLCQKFKDEKLLALFSKIIDSYTNSPCKGLPIGNLTSQYFANFYLAHADHYIKEDLKVKAYVRYMDDMVFWGKDNEALCQTRDRFAGFIETKLSLEVKPCCLHQTTQGLPFLGYTLFPVYTRLNKQSKKRFLRKIDDYNTKLEEGSWSQQEYASHVVPLIAFTKHASCSALRAKQRAWKETG